MKKWVFTAAALCIVCLTVFMWTKWGHSMKKADAVSCIGMVMVTERAAFTGAQFKKALNDMWPDLPEPVDLDVKDDAATFMIDGMRYALAYMPAPIPKDELDYPVKTEENWKDAAEKIAKHRGHYIIFCSSGEKSRVDVAGSLARVVAAFVRMTNPVGVYWGGSAQVFEPGMFIEYCSLMKNNLLPVPVFVKVTGYKKDNGNYYVYTVGLSEFDMREFEVMDYKGSHKDAFSLLIEASNYLLENGPVIKNGDTIGFTEEQKIKVKYKKSEIKKGVNVMSLTF